MTARPAPPWGVGLRSIHFHEWEVEAQLPVLEVMSDNFLRQRGGPGWYHLERYAERTTLVAHGVGLSVGSAGGVHPQYLRMLKDFVDRLQPQVVSDHLCFSRSHAHNSFDLLPLKRCPEMLEIICDNVSRTQEALGRTIALENVSEYVEWKGNTLSEGEFLNAICERTGCGILLDVNNLYVNQVNFGRSALQTLQELKTSHVVQYHVAGHTVCDGYLNDTHDKPVCPEVWKILGEALLRFGPQPVILENDADEITVSDLKAEIRVGQQFVRTGDLSGAHPLREKEMSTS